MKHCPQSVNSSPPGQDGRHFPDDIFKCILMNEKFWILIQISLKFVPKGPIDNNPALVKFGLDNGLATNRQQAIVWTNADPIHWRIYAALGGGELIKPLVLLVHDSTTMERPGNNTNNQNSFSDILNFKHGYEENK